MAEQVRPQNLANEMPDENKNAAKNILSDCSSSLNINASAKSVNDASVVSGIPKPTILKKVVSDSTEANESNKDMEEITRAVKKRRRSVMFEERPEITEQPSPTESRPSASKRRSIARLSLLAIPSIVTIEDEVSKLCQKPVQSSTLNQMVDIGIRHSFLKLYQKENKFSDLSSLKTKITMSSEQIADGAVQALKSNKIDMANIIPSLKTLQKDNKKTSDKDYIDRDELEKQRWILKKYQTETQKLAKEREKWKTLRKERNQLRRDAIKLHSESVSGMHRIGEDVSLSSCDRTFLSAKPNYSAILDVTAKAVNSSVASLVKSKSLLAVVQMNNREEKERLEKAYNITVASTLGRTYSSPRNLLRSFHSSKKTETLSQ